jgi:hypothetical protein
MYGMGITVPVSVRPIDTNPLDQSILRAERSRALLLVAYFHFSIRRHRE